MAASLHVLLVAGPEVDAPAVLQELREAGFEPKAALAPTDAAIDEALAHRAWDVALFMPDPGAPGLMERILRVNVAQPDVPVIVVGAGEDGVADEAVPAATAEWLGPAIGRVLSAAPISLDELLLTATEPAPEPEPEPVEAPAAEAAPDAASTEEPLDDRLRVVQDLAAH
ncbi:MAG TPA: hypothetical protein VK610_02930, partial [Rhodothermales bacterium]|nr:hypothetical protein [Rhodothermales bacterium]